MGTVQPEAFAPQHAPPSALKPPKTGDPRLARLYEAAGCRTQAELAGVLGIRQSSVAVAKRRRTIPAHWLLTLMRTRGINPEWILDGTGDLFVS